MTYDKFRAQKDMKKEQKVIKQYVKNAGMNGSILMAYLNIGYLVQSVNQKRIP